ncbi:Serine/threonine-protein kinase ppk6, partial [Neolecta irregularis DAH-3]
TATTTTATTASTTTTTTPSTRTTASTTTAASQSPSRTTTQGTNDTARSIHQSVLPPCHLAARCIAHQAVFSTRPFYPYTILSFNDVASLLFALTHSHVRILPILDLFVHDSRATILAKIKQVPSEVILCGDVFSIVSRAGARSHASLWLRRRDEWLIWVMEQVDLKVLHAQLDPALPHRLLSATGDVAAITTYPHINNISISDVIPSWTGVDGYYTLATPAGRIPVNTHSCPRSLTITHLPYLSGIILIDSADLSILSLNPVFAKFLLGFHPPPHSTKITAVIPKFTQLLEYIMTLDSSFEKGKVISELTFTRAAKAISSSNKIYARHYDSGEIPIDIQMRLVEKPVPSKPCFEIGPVDELDAKEELNGKHRVNGKHEAIELNKHEPDELNTKHKPEEYYYALWVTFSRDLSPAPVPPPIDQLLESQPSQNPKRNIEDFEILENMGEGAYGRVKKVRNKHTGKVAVMKYVTKSRILVDTWHRDRTLGTIPLEIHILDYMSRYPHPHIMQLLDFFEDSSYYYLETLPIGPGLDLFDYIEHNSCISQSESRKLFRQIAKAVGHLHDHGIVHRDIKDENVVLDFENNAVLIDFGSAAWSPCGVGVAGFDTFHGTLDYAAPEVLKGMKYSGKEQDVWALGILAYTVVYRENPFYNIDEIMDANLRIPFDLEFDGIGLISWMLERDVAKRPTMKQVLSHPWCLN